MITGAHVLIYSPAADALRAFFRDVLELSYIDSGGGWLVFALPPAELAVHPVEEGGSHELYLMCDDIEVTIAELTSRGVEFDGGVTDEGYGLQTMMQLPDGSRLNLYQPRHPTAFS